jgi:uncharacterized protein
MQLLLTAGADISMKDLNGYTSLFLAAQWGGICAVNWLLQNGATCSDVDEDGNTVLHYASLNYFNNGDISRRLLKDNPGLVLARNHTGQTALLKLDRSCLF